MKRCPQCLFLFPDSDEKCDFDQTPLEAVDDSAIEAAPRPRKRRMLPIGAAVGLVLCVVAFGIYYGLNRPAQKASAATQSSTVVVPAPSPSLAATPPPTRS